MDPDDDFEFNEDFLDDFIPRDEPRDELLNSENSSKRQKIDSENCVVSSISFRLNDDDDDDDKNEISTTNENKNKKSTNNSRLTKILQICQKKKNSSLKENEHSQSENSRELNFHDNSSNNLSLNLSTNSHIENQRSRVSFLIDDNNDDEGEKNREDEEEEEKREEGRNDNKIYNEKTNIRANFLKSILSRKKRKIDEIEQNEKNEENEENEEKRKEKGKEKRDEEEEEKRDEEDEEEIEEFEGNEGKKGEKNEKTNKAGNIEQKENKIQNRQNLINSILKNRGKKPEIESDNDETKARRNVSFSNDSTTTENKNQKYKQLKLNFPQTNESTKNPLNSPSIINNSHKGYRSRKTINSSHNKSRTNLNNSKSDKNVINRRFPGPAGLLPPNMDFTNFPMAYLKTFDESETTVERLNETRITNFCSQNTKNRFTSGAWQMMIDDLPVDFFQALDLATIKRQAKKGHYKMKRTKFFAALVHQMDSNTIINPIVVLKDSSDEMEASIHRSIISKYPNAIDVGVVLLLNDVTIITSKFYNMALVHTRDVVAIYNEKERIVTTELMEKILREQEGSNFDDSRDTCNEERTIREKRLEKVQQEREERTEELSAIDSTKDNNNEKSTTISASRENVINPKQILHDNKDNEFLSQLNLDEISVSNINDPRIVASSTLIGNEIHLENDSGECSTQMEISNENSQEQINTGKSTVILDEGNFTDLLESEEEADESSSPKRGENNEKIVEKKIEENAPGPSKLQSYLKQFRHSEELTQPEVVIENKKNNEMEKNLENLNFSSLPSSDDELMDNNIPNECDNGTTNEIETPVENTQGVRNNLRNFFNDDEDDEFLSQVNIDDL